LYCAVLPKAWSAYSLSNLTGLGSEADRLFRRKEKKKKGRRRGNVVIVFCAIRLSFALIKKTA
jgi:hypothetical protein